MIFVDSNVPIYAAGEPDRLQPPCLQIMRAVAATSGTFVTNAEVLQEVLHVSRRGGRSSRGRTVFDVFAEAMGREVLPIDRADVVQAAQLAEAAKTRISTRDFVHLATMRRHGIERIVSADRDFDAFPEITRLDPAKLEEWADPAWFPKG